jgi:anti-sigma-K factor RskA
MTTRDHDSYQEEIGAYLLGALTDLERQAFERHIATCGLCRDELERLRPAANALPRSVEQLAPPPSLKASLMEVVEREASAGEPEPAHPARRAPLWRRLAPSGSWLRPALVAGALLLGLVAGFGVAQLAGDDEASRTIVATVDETRIPQASGTLRVEGDGADGAILRVNGMPALQSDRVYQVWVQRGSEVVPGPLFAVRGDGRGGAAVTESLDGADAVMVTREQAGGARAPSSDPIVTVPL